MVCGAIAQRALVGIGRAARWNRRHSTQQSRVQHEIRLCFRRDAGFCPRRLFAGLSMVVALPRRYRLRNGMALPGLVRATLLSASRDVGVLRSLHSVARLELWNELERGLAGLNVLLGMGLGRLDSRLWTGLSSRVLVRVLRGRMVWSWRVSAATTAWLAPAWTSRTGHPSAAQIRQRPLRSTRPARRSPEPPGTASGAPAVASFRRTGTAALEAADTTYTARQTQRCRWPIGDGSNKAAGSTH